MRNQHIVDLAECSKFRQTLLARPPAIAHGTVLILTCMLAAALVWLSLTRANLVVRGAGRVRPLETPENVFSGARGDVLSASTGGRVVEVHFREGDVVQQGALLIRLETEQVDNQIARQLRTIQGAEEELVNLRRLVTLTVQQFEGARRKSGAELTQAREDVTQAEKVRDVETRRAEADLDSARDEEGRLRKLLAASAVAQADVVKAGNRLRDAEQNLVKARLPVSQSRVQIAQRALEQVDSDYAVRGEELKLRCQVKEGELAAARSDLARLQLERNQAEIRAPVTGVVTRGDVKVSDVLQPGKPIIEIANQTAFLFETAVTSEDFGRLHLGMPVQIKLDAYDYQRYGTVTGTVIYLSPDSGVAEGQTHATHLVRIALDSNEVGRGEYHDRVKLGMSGQADIVTGEESLLSLMVKRIRQTISLK